MHNDRPVLAVIPARGGSKGLPGKNLRRLAGTSLVGRAVLTAAAAPEIDAIAVSSDDDAILAEGREHGATLLVTRPEDLSSDSAGALETWRHAWLEAEARLGTTFDYAVYLEPTSPLRTVEDIRSTLETLSSRGVATAATVSPSAAHCTPEKTLLVDADGRLGHYLENGEQYAIRQKIRHRYFHRNGLCYAARREAIVNGSTIIGSDTAAVIVERPVANIDTALDFDYAAWLLSREADHPAR